MPKRLKELPEGAIDYERTKAATSGIGKVLRAFIDSDDTVLVWDETEIKGYGSKKEEQPYEARRNILIGSIRRSLGTLKESHPETTKYKYKENPAKKEVYLVKE